MLRIPCEKVTPLVYPTIPVIISLPCPKSKKPQKNNRAKCGICSKLTTNTPGRQCSHFGVFSVNFEQISHVFLVFRTFKQVKCLPR